MTTIDLTCLKTSTVFSVCGKPVTQSNIAGKKFLQFCCKEKLRVNFENFPVDFACCCR